MSNHWLARSYFHKHLDWVYIGSYFLNVTAVIIRDHRMWSESVWKCSGAGIWNMEVCLIFLQQQGERIDSNNAADQKVVRNILLVRNSQQVKCVREPDSTGVQQETAHVQMAGQQELNLWVLWLSCQQQKRFTLVTQTERREQIALIPLLHSVGHRFSHLWHFLADYQPWPAASSQTNFTQAFMQQSDSKPSLI